MNIRQSIGPIAANQLPALLWAGLIFSLSSISQLPEPDLGITFLDKLTHLAEFSIFFLLVFRVMERPPILLKGKALAFFSLVLPVVFAISDELHQRFVPGRQADPADLAADMAGVMLGGLGVAVYCRRQSAKALSNH